MKEYNEICALANNEENKKQRYSPQNAKHAWVFQLHDTLKILLPLAVMDDAVSWNKQLDVLESQIKLARKA